MGKQSRLNRDRRRIEQERSSAGGGVVIAWISPGQTSHYFTESISHTIITGMRDGWLANILTDWSSANVSASRNKLTGQFLDMGAGEWLLWVDSDMQWEPDAIPALLAAADPVERPIVGGLCFGNSSEGMYPTIYMGYEESGQFTTIRVRDYPRDTLVRVAATGAAFLLVHRSALERIRERGFDRAFPFFAESSGNGKPVGEDITFCIRAGIVGVPVHVHTGVRIGHHKSALLTEDEFLKQLPVGLPPSVGMVVPTRGDHPDLLAATVAASGLPAERIVVIDTVGGQVDPALPVTVVEDAGPVNIHRWWNTGINLLAERGCTRVAVLNDDLVIGPDTLPALWRGMGSATLGLVEGQGPSGHLFMLDVTHGVRPDESYRWYCGDLQLVADAENRGRGVARVPGVWHLHLHAAQATESSAALRALAAADDDLYDERHPPGSRHAAVRST